MTILPPDSHAFRLPPAIESVLQEAGTDISGLAQTLVINYVIASGKVDPAVAKAILARQRLMNRLISIARARHLVKGITTDNNYAVITEAFADADFKAAYDQLGAKDDVNREFGRVICQAVGSKVDRTKSGKPKQKRVADSVIGSYTVMIAEPPAKKAPEAGNEENPEAGTEAATEPSVK